MTTRSAQQSPHLILAAGIGVGLLLPYLARSLRRALGFPESSSPPSHAEKDDAAKDEGDGNDTHAVRSGLHSSGVRVPRSRLEPFLADCLMAAGVTSRSRAELTAAVLVYADARGIPSHGSNRADLYCNEVESGAVDGNAVPVVERTSGCTAVIDGRNGLGAASSDLAMDSAISMARAHGVGVAVCRNSNHFGAAGFWARKALREGMIGMSFTNTSPQMVPTGGQTRSVGTNPFCFFAPAEGKGREGAGRDNFQLDMATTVVPIGKIEVMDRISKPCPSGWGLDGSGKNCNDPAQICKEGGLYPLGGPEETAGYKGYGLGMFVEIICSVLSGAAVGPDVSPWNPSRDGAIDYGHAFIVVDPARFTPGFEERLGKYLRTMRSLPGNVRVAGDPEKEFEKDAAENGVLLHGPVAATLKKLAGRFGVETPVEFESLDASSTRESLYN